MQEGYEICKKDRSAAGLHSREAGRLDKGKGVSMMTLQEIRKAVEKAKNECRNAHVKVLDEEIGGEVVFVELTARFKVEKAKKTLDSCK